MVVVVSGAYFLLRPMSHSSFKDSLHGFLRGFIITCGISDGRVFGRSGVRLVRPSVCIQVELCVRSYTFMLADHFIRRPGSYGSSSVHGRGRVGLPRPRACVLGGVCVGG